jgi:hypothetical protein
MIQPKIGQIWVDKTTGDRVKVIKILPGHVKIFDTEGSNYGKQEQIEIHVLIAKYKLYADA